MSLSFVKLTWNCLMFLAWFFLYSASKFLNLCRSIYFHIFFFIICLFVYLCLYILFIICLFMFIYFLLFTCLLAYTFFLLFIYLFTYVYIFFLLFVYLFTYVPNSFYYLFICVFIYLPFRTTSKVHIYFKIFYIQHNSIILYTQLQNSLESQNI